MRRLVSCTIFIMWYLLSANTTFAYTHADTLRGSNGRGRSWWDVQKYSLLITIDAAKQEIAGHNTIRLKVIDNPADSMQIDLQDSLKIIAVETEGKRIEYVKDGNVWWLKHRFDDWTIGSIHEIIVYYKGAPRKAVRPPWDGGFTWTKDSLGNPWISVSCQGLGASAWWPCKDAQWDEPDSGMNISIYIPGKLQVVSNGQLAQKRPNPVGASEADAKGYTWDWVVKNPINNYDVTFYVGDYIHWQDTLMGEKGILPLDFYALRYNEERAKKQFAIVKPMLHCYEYWLGAYPFYEDGYKLVEAPYVGMEHQSAVAYGNKYKMGYEGHDRSFTGIGMSFNYIIIHESAHEWFGNNITSKDIADMWIHEGLTTYSESLFVECMQGKEKGMEYCRGEWQNIRNDKPVIGDYGVNNEGSEDMYDKGAAAMYMIRIMTHDDEKFRGMLRGLGDTFYHQTVTTQQVESYIAEHTGLDLKSFFNQYLRTTDIPELEYYIKDKELYYKFNNVVTGFTLPIPVSAGKIKTTISPKSVWQHTAWKGVGGITVSKDFLITVVKK